MNTDFKPICCTAYVFGKYTDYIPYYIYSILKSYPDYYVKIFVQQSLSKKEKLCLNLVSKGLSDHFEIKENYFNNIWLPAGRKGLVIMKALRWLIPCEELKEYRNAYIGDVDFLIVRENPSLLEGHLDHCKKIELPYSNRIRSGTKRLTGLHFIQVHEYYQKMNDIIRFCLRNSEKLYQMLSRMQSNEEFLYRIVEIGIGFGKITEYKYRPMHGFHLGWLRGTKESTGYFVPDKSNSQRVEYDILKNELNKYFNDPLFIQMLSVLPNPEIIKLSKLVGPIERQDSLGNPTRYLKKYKNY